MPHKACLQSTPIRNSRQGVPKPGRGSFWQRDRTAAAAACLRARLSNTRGINELVFERPPSGGSAYADLAARA